jgi:hypothetical protein
MLPAVSDVPRRRGCVGAHAGPSAVNSPRMAAMRSDEGIIESQPILGSIA